MEERQGRNAEVYLKDLSVSPFVFSQGSSLRLTILWFTFQLLAPLIRGTAKCDACTFKHRRKGQREPQRVYYKELYRFSLM
jgi:hypothetical protein